MGQLEESIALRVASQRKGSASDRRNLISSNGGMKEKDKNQKSGQPTYAALGLAPPQSLLFHNGVHLLRNVQ